jgi:hypothetical protein
MKYYANTAAIGLPAGTKFLLNFRWRFDVLAADIARQNASPFTGAVTSVYSGSGIGL